MKEKSSNLTFNRGTQSYEAENLLLLNVIKNQIGFLPWHGINS